eukprot:SAG11_NODE_3612_length_2340_cov_2.134315_2_plen_149_part_00
MELSSFTAANLRPPCLEPPCEPPRVLWLAVVATIFIFLFANVFIFAQWKRLHRLKYSSEEAKQKVLGANTVMVDGFPKDVVADRTFFAEMQKVLPGWVCGAHVALDLRELIKCEREVEDAKRQLRRYSTRACYTRACCTRACCNRASN